MSTTAKRGGESADLERYWAEMRAGATAKQLLDSGDRIPAGAVITFVPSVLAPRARAWGRGALRVSRTAARRAYRFADLTTEPGTVVPAGEQLAIHTVIETEDHTVRYTWVEGCDVPDVPDATYEVVRGDGTPEWIGLLPKSRVHDANPANLVKAQLRRCVRNGTHAENDACAIALGKVRDVFFRQFQHHMGRYLATDDEAMENAYDFIVEAVRLYGSPNRPAHTWARHLEKTLPREIDRGAHQYDIESEDDRACRREIEARLDRLSTPGDPEEMWTLIALDKTRDKLARKHPHADAVEIEEMLADLAAEDRLTCRFSKVQVTRLMGAPAPIVVSVDQPFGEDGDGTLGEVVTGFFDQNLDDVEEAGLDAVFNDLFAMFGEDEMAVVRHYLVEHGLFSGEDRRAKAIPVSGPVGRVLERFFSPFLARGEKWSVSAHRRAARERAYTAFTVNGALLPATEIVRIYEAAAARPATG